MSGITIKSGINELLQAISSNHPSSSEYQDANAKLDKIVDVKEKRTPAFFIYLLDGESLFPIVGAAPQIKQYTMTTELFVRKACQNDRVCVRPISIQNVGITQ
jgi:hypothetical protein